MRLSILHCIVSLAIAAPEITFPFNSQVPPVARVSQPYHFQLATTTFAVQSEAQYDLSEAPAWLSIDGTSGSLTGTPSVQDAGVLEFAIIASDSSGSSTMHCTLIVTNDRPPELVQDLSPQMQEFGSLPAPATLSVHPGDSFNLGFSQQTFAPGSAPVLTHYAVLADRTPLPSWIHFDPSSLSFTGIAPDFAGAPQSINMTLVAADVLGFEGASASFTLGIAQNCLAFTPQAETQNVNGNISIASLLSQLRLNSIPIASSQIATAQVSAPAWILFNNESLLVSGQVPHGFTTAQLSISVADVFGNTAQKTIDLQNTGNVSSAGPFTGSLTPGEIIKSTAKSEKKTVMVFVVCILGPALVLGLLFAFLYQRRHNKESTAEKNYMSDPVLRLQDKWQFRNTLENAGDPILTAALDSVEKEAPQIYLRIANSPLRSSPFKTNRISATSSLGAGEDTIKADDNIPLWGQKAIAKPPRNDGYSVATRGSSSHLSARSGRRSKSFSRLVSLPLSAIESRRTVRLVEQSESTTSHGSFYHTPQSLVSRRASERRNSSLSTPSERKFRNLSGQNHPQFIMLTNNEHDLFPSQQTLAQSGMGRQQWRPIPSIEPQDTVLPSSSARSSLYSTPSASSLRAEMALPRHLRNWVLPGEASPTPPPQSHVTARAEASKHSTGVQSSSSVGSLSLEVVEPLIAIPPRSRARVPLGTIGAENFGGRMGGLGQEMGTSTRSQRGRMAFYRGVENVYLGDEGGKAAARDGFTARQRSSSSSLSMAFL